MLNYNLKNKNCATCEHYECSRDIKGNKVILNSDGKCKKMSSQEMVYPHKTGCREYKRCSLIEKALDLQKHKNEQYSDLNYSSKGDNKLNCETHSVKGDTKKTLIIKSTICFVVVSILLILIAVILISSRNYHQSIYDIWVIDHLPNEQLAIEQRNIIRYFNIALIIYGIASSIFLSIIGIALARKTKEKIKNLEAKKNEISG